MREITPYAQDVRQGLGGVCVAPECGKRSPAEG